MTEDGELLLITLDLAVPLEIERLRHFTANERVQLGHRLVDIIAAEGDNLLYLGHKKGDHRASLRGRSHWAGSARLRAWRGQVRRPAVGSMSSNPYLKKILAAPAYSPRGVKVKVDWHDVWIGVFWKCSRWPWISSEARGWRIDFFICLVPCLPIRVWWSWE